MSDNIIDSDDLKKIIDNLKNAIYKTLEKYDKGQVQFAIYSLLKEDEFDVFTNNDNARSNLQRFGLENVKSAIYKDYIDKVLGNFEGSSEPVDIAIKRTYDKYKNYESIDMDKTLENILRNSIENNEDISVVESICKRIAEPFILNQIDNIKKNQISNIQVNSRNLEQCRSAIMSGAKGFQREGTISIGQELTACSSIGKIRKNQEDAVLLIEHPQNPEFKMMVVADGMGGLEAGEEASNILVNEIEGWFESLDVSYFDNMEDLDDDLNQQLQTISDYIYQKFRGRAGTTFVGAVVGKNYTLISNVGDSRGYILQGKELTQVTKDHSLVQYLYDRGKIQDKDDMRFRKDSNYITQSIGTGDILEPSSQILENSRYDSVILTSDGVTDCLSDTKLLAITRSTDKRKLAEVLVQEALNTNSFRTENLGSSEYDDVIYGGKDNATVAVYNKDDSSESGREKSNPQKNWRKDDDGTNNSVNKLKDAIEIESPEPQYRDREIQY